MTTLLPQEQTTIARKMNGIIPNKQSEPQGVAEKALTNYNSNKE